MLRSFGRAFVKDRGHGRFERWQIATGSPQQIRDAAAIFSLNYWADEGQFTHSLRTAIIGPDGRLARLYPDN